MNDSSKILIYAQFVPKLEIIYAFVCFMHISKQFQNYKMVS